MGNVEHSQGRLVWIPAVLQWQQSNAGQKRFILHLDPSWVPGRCRKTGQFSTHPCETPAVMEKESRGVIQMCLPSLVRQAEMEGTGFPYTGADPCLHNDAILNNKARTQKSGAEQCSVNISLICYIFIFSQATKTGTDRFLENTAKATNELKLIISFITQWHGSSKRAHLPLWWTIADNMFQLRRNLQRGLPASYNTCQIPVDTSYGLLIRDNPSLGETLQFPQIFLLWAQKPTELLLGLHISGLLFTLTLIQKGKRGEIWISKQVFRAKKAKWLLKDWVIANKDNETTKNW